MRSTMRLQSQPLEDMVGASKGTRLFVVCVSLAGVVTSCCVTALLVMYYFVDAGCGELPDWDHRSDPAKRQSACTGEPCKETKCEPAPDNTTCDGVVRSFADGCRCCPACVAVLGLDEDCSNRISDRRDARQCGAGLYCNKRYCTCKKYIRAP
ncbi:uncharacterized protein [Dermacentor albipictus]|uniref:uncharacterized protein n=1 Tax=Dermacentor albipictus TaxID=60249 RepID=UPI0038FC94CC